MALFTQRDIENFNNFISDNSRHLTAIGVFGALMWYFALNVPKGSSIGEIIAFITILIFLLFIYTLIVKINSLSNREKGKCTDYFKILLSIFAFLLVIFTIEKFPDAITGILKLGLIGLTFFILIKLYTKELEEKLKENVKNNLLAFIIGLIILYLVIISENCNIINKESFIYIIVGLIIFIIIFLILIIPGLFLASKLLEWIKNKYKEILKKVFIILVILILIVLTIYILSLIFKFDFDSTLITIFNFFKWIYQIILEILKYRVC